MAATNFPFNLSGLASLKNSSGNIPRMNMKNDGTYSIASQITLAATCAPMIVQGYSSALGDGGRSTIDAGTNAIVSWSSSSTNGNVLIDLIFSTSASSGANPLVSDNGSGIVSYIRCVFTGARASGLIMQSGLAYECEAYSNNTSNGNTAGSRAGFSITGSGTARLVRCISHDNTGSNTRGFECNSGTGVHFIDCISESNGQAGYDYLINGSASQLVLTNCDAYSNGGDGLLIEFSSGSLPFPLIENSNFIKNSGKGINVTASATQVLGGHVYNCGYGSGTQANAGGDSALGSILEFNKVTYASGVTPWVDPANGDFRISLSAAKNSGRGNFTQTQASYSGTVAYPDIGSAQHLDSGGTSTQKAYTFGG